jgi:hypothetical protein
LFSPITKSIYLSLVVDGQLQEKLTVRNGRKHGIARTWHRNGVLASKERFRDGLLHCICRQWDESDRLLGEFEMNHGTGIQHEWHDNGQLKLEVSTVHGRFCGRNRIWLRDGTLISERFYLHGEEVTPAMYGKATAQDASLPRCTEPPASLPKTTIVTRRHIHEVFVASLLDKPNRQEARAWLSNKDGRKGNRLMGRFRSPRAALEFVEKFYETGAVEVIVPGIYCDKKGNEFADALLILLPKAKAARMKIRKVCAALRARSLGSFQPEADIGESHLYVLME